MTSDRPFVQRLKVRDSCFPDRSNIQTRGYEADSALSLADTSMAAKMNQTGGVIKSSGLNKKIKGRLDLVYTAA